MHMKLLSPAAFLSPKCTKYRLAAGLRPDPLVELTALPRPLSWIKGPTSKVRGGEWDWEEGEGRGRKGRARRKGGGGAYEP